MGDHAIRAGTALVDGKVTGPVVLRVSEGLITSLDPPTGDAPYDVSAATVVPGLIDVHTHGAAGVQVIDGSDADIEGLAVFYAEHGVTGFLATVGGSREHLLAGVAAVADHIDRAPHRGARCLGVHLEGPFLSPHAPGAFRAESIVAPDLGLFAELLDAARGHVRMMTIAPETPGAMDLIAVALRHGVTCSAGHSVASAAQVATAVDAGVRGVTHLFNGMAPFHHREPGLIGAALADPRLVCELIADGVHVHPTAIALAASSKGWQGLALVSDSIAATGLPEGSYELEEQHVTVTGEEARLADGTLAGSTLTLDRAVANLARWTGLALVDAARSATEVPARLVGLGDHHGTIAGGGRADLAGFDDEHRLLWTMVGGDLYPAGAS
ncbi:N-acetylglucosamine-6-phosphate deacetylase [Nocardioides glacieisoli]|uniref:N-acetylglucosamine-6-phosphate deacetylase n=1 Tax=Nocardioides glacieisoli TaxID=1168730 RepID=UPI0013EDEBB2|nr:N-acetylglucosamine-6-phosphate deacetylase [Nocardioides glacieisoli]